ncbi:dolichyl-diphosphooligosaccharide--protein glycosyltransferase subunit 1 [Teleopsis dalmanni]|uniref:dolichyl-diphosphooligosaccharide--protein glycosyltransferase subunit 1 n=1 Tax=Teleopsis dalmanni TaxID=139649 RepID=UPI0018CF79C8|nr:dolichyl-diphosphooligosaccharide--protein glycosyltransferase subunit 1 [Teleopsis dalmanni]
MYCGKAVLSLLIIINIVFLAKSHIINQNVDRNIDLSTQLVKESIKITAEDSDNKPIKEYIFSLSENDSKKLAFISATLSLKKYLDIKQRKGATDKNEYVITFQTPAPTQVFHIELVFTNNVIPHPEQIKQSDKQLVRYTGNLYYFSNYKTKTQKTSIKLSTSNIISYTQVKPYNVVSNKVKYGPYENIDEQTNVPLVLHYENNSPFMTIKYLERTIEVSHWGNIAVKESIALEHSGAKLKGSFSRYEYQKDGSSGVSSVKSYKTYLPASSTRVSYRDSNGNISTSNMRVMRDSVELELRPRYPLFGGWKTHYVLGYNVPTFEYLYKNNDNYMLQMRVIDHIFESMVIEDAVVKIILPEGTSNFELITPYTVTRNKNELVHTYLDTVGRPVITFSKKNLVENHIADFKLKYKFSTISLLQEPLLVIVFIYAIFLFTIICLRLNFSITTHSHKD